MGGSWADCVGPQLTLEKTGARNEKEHFQVRPTSGHARQNPCSVDPVFLTSSQPKDLLWEVEPHTEKTKMHDIKVHSQGGQVHFSARLDFPVLHDHPAAPLCCADMFKTT